MLPTHSANHLTIRTKICGITSVDNAIHVSHAGVDAIGLVFYPKSSRYIQAHTAQDIVANIPPFVTTVGLFLNASHTEVSEVLAKVSLDVLQFHGTESADYCRSFSKPNIKAVGMLGLDDFNAYTRPYHDAKGFLVDSHRRGEAGGSGETFDWNNIPSSDKPIILAGGLHADNVAQALQQARLAGQPLYGVDVSSGVEQSPGVKDMDKVKHFMTEVGRFSLGC